MASQLKTIIALLLLCLAAEADAQLPTPKRETRAVWLTTYNGLDWPKRKAAEAQRAELSQMLDQLKAAGVNLVLFQTRIRGTVVYPSAMEPWDACLTGVAGRSPGYDPLAFAIGECHKRGMELHAWVVALPVGKWGGAGCKALRRKAPRMVRRIAGEGYMNPEREQTADYLARLCGEMTAGYDLDGIHLDYIRYPETWPITVSRERGRDNITRIVRAIGREVKAKKPWVKVSCAPIGKHDDLSRYASRGWNAYNRVCQDAQGWLAEGIVDAIFPMMYFRGDQFFPFALDWAENAHGRIVAPGLGVYMMSRAYGDWPAETLHRELAALRANGMGHAYFRARHLTDNLKGIHHFARYDIDRWPALVPPMTWQSKARPKPPTTLEITRTEGGDMLRWSGATDNSGAPGIYYNVYASEKWPVDTADARNIIAARLASEQAFVHRKASKGKLHYAVTAMNRYGNESRPIVSPADKEQAPMASKLLENDGKRLSLPATIIETDADLITIETPQGSAIATRRRAGASIDISALPEGYYILRSVGRKSSHRLGHFAIRRKPLFGE